MNITRIMIPVVGLRKLYLTFTLIQQNYGKSRETEKQNCQS